MCQRKEDQRVPKNKMVVLREKRYARNGSDVPIRYNGQTELDAICLAGQTPTDVFVGGPRSE